MRISELSRASDVSIASIKYYLREGLLPAGTPTAANQSSYGEEHLRRLTLIRAMIDIAGLPVAAARRVIDAIDSPNLPLPHVLGIAQTAASEGATYRSSGPGVGRERIQALAESRGWPCWNDGPGLSGAANVIDAFVLTGHPQLVDSLDAYAEAAEIIARADLAAVRRQTDVAGMAETVVVGTVLGDALLAALRRMAQVAVTQELFPAQSQPVPSSTADRNGPSS